MSTMRAPVSSRSANPIAPIEPKPGAPVQLARTAGTVADRVRARAYEIYETRKCNGVHGDAVSDWVQAEREINGIAAVQPPPLPAVVRARGEALLANPA